MMTEEQAIELGRRAVAAGWKWQAGAVDTSRWRCVYVDRHGAWGLTRGWPPQLFDATDTPDFRDPATLGILRQQVVALVPRAAEIVVMRWFGATIGATVRWCAAGGGWIGPEHWAHGVGGAWPIEALVACLEAAKEGKL